MKKEERKIKELIDSSYPKTDLSFKKIENKINWKQYSVKKKKRKILAISLSTLATATAAFLIVYLSCPELFKPKAPNPSSTIMPSKSSNTEIYSYGEPPVSKLQFGTFMFSSCHGKTGSFTFKDTDSIIINETKPQSNSNQMIEIEDPSNKLHCFVIFNINALKDFKYELIDLDRNQYFINLSNETKLYKGTLLPSKESNSEILFKVTSSQEDIDFEIHYTKAH